MRTPPVKRKYDYGQKNGSFRGGGGGWGGGVEEKGKDQETEKVEKNP